MIVEWLNSLWVGMASWTLGLAPGWAPGQEYASGLAAILGPVSSAAYGLGAWIPWSVGTFWLNIVIACYFGSLIVRAIKSLIPTISG